MIASVPIPYSNRRKSLYWWVLDEPDGNFPKDPSSPLWNNLTGDQTIYFNDTDIFESEIRIVRTDLIFHEIGFVRINFIFQASLCYPFKISQARSDWRFTEPSISKRMQSQECWIQDETPSLQLCTFGRQRYLATPPRRFDLDSNQRIPTHFQVTHNDKAWSLRRFKTTCYLPNIDYNTNHDHRNDLYVVYDNICDNNQLKTAKLPRYFFMPIWYTFNHQHGHKLQFYVYKDSASVCQRIHWIKPNSYGIRFHDSQPETKDYYESLSDTTKLKPKSEDADMNQADPNQIKLHLHSQRNHCWELIRTALVPRGLNQVQNHTSNISLSIILETDL